MADHNTEKHKANFIAAATEKHNGFYDYSDVVYVNASTRVDIRCPKHGTFRQAPADHKKGQRCSQCSGRRGATAASRADLFIEQSKTKFGDQFDYSKVVFTDQRTNVTLICKTHGEFTIRPTNHLSSVAGCRDCADKVRAKSVSAAAKAARERTGDLPKRFEKAAGGDAAVVRVELLSKPGGRFPRPYPGFDVLLGAGHEVRDIGATVVGHFHTGVAPERRYEYDEVVRPSTDRIDSFRMRETFDFVSGVLPELFGGYRFRCTFIAVGVDAEVLTGEPLTEYPDLPRILEYRGGVTSEYGQRF